MGCAVLLSAALSLSLPTPSEAAWSFGKQSPLVALASTDALEEDINVSLASDGAGTWLAAWESDNTLSGTIGSDVDVLMSRSVDDGQTWSIPIALNTTASADSVFDGGVILAHDAGVWIAAWTISGFAHTSRSVDGGLTWSVPLSLGVSGGPNELIVSPGSTTLLAFTSADDLGGTIGSDLDVLYFRSTDAAASWSPAGTINTDAAVDCMSVTCDDGIVDIATDGAGNWLAVWHVASGSEPMRGARSVDDGLTWSAPYDLSAAVGGVDGRFPKLDTNGSGRWLVAWSTFGTNPAWLPQASEPDALYSVSDDLGNTWSQADVINTTAYATESDGEDARPIVRSSGGESWLAVWSKVPDVDSSFIKAIDAGDAELFMAQSHDNGTTWSEPSLLNTHGVRDKKGGLGDTAGCAVVDSAGTTIVAWHSTDELEEGIGTDQDIHFSRAVNDCPSAPLPGCIASTASGKDKIQLKNPLGEKDVLVWSLRKGDETLAGDVGDPTATSDYAFCLFDDKSGGVQLVMEKDMAAAAQCKGKACWSAINGGYRYSDGRNEHGTIKSLKIKAGAAGKTKIKLKGKGITLGSPVMPFELSPSMTAQLLNLETGSCWESLFSAPSDNTAELLKGKSD